MTLLKKMFCELIVLFHSNDSLVVSYYFFAPVRSLANFPISDLSSKKENIKIKFG